MPNPMDYLAVDRHFNILETSLAVQRFADYPHQVKKGKDVRLAFPELSGIEEIIIAIFEGRINSFELKGIKRLSDPCSPLYIDISVFANKQEKSSDKVFILLEDVTKKIVLEQNLAQTIEETNLLSNALTAYRDYVDKILYSMTDVLLVTTAAGCIKTVNQATKDLFGYSEEELINHPIAILINDENFLSPLNQNHHFKNPSKILKDVEVTCQTKSGKTLILSFSCSVIQGGIENVKNFVYIGRDITKRKQAEAEIRNALAKEKEINELKNRFFSMITHEFGNPLNSILMAVALLEYYDDESTEEEKVEYLHHIKTAANHMTQLLKDVLVINKAEAGKLNFNPSGFDLIKFCDELIEQIKLGAGGKKSISFVSKDERSREQGKKEIKQEEGANNFASPSLFASVNTLCSVSDTPVSLTCCLDENLLRHILSNLLSNAVKYSPEGTTVSFELTCGEKEVIFQIKDEGIGIPLEDQQRLFESFHRGKNVGQIPGTGLGLSIVKQAVDLHGGKIAVVSEVGVGTTFTVTIPLSGGVQT